MVRRLKLNFLSTADTFFMCVTYRGARTLSYAFVAVTVVYLIKFLVVTQDVIAFVSALALVPACLQIAQVASYIYSLF